MSTAPFRIPDHPVQVGLDAAVTAVGTARTSMVSGLSDDDLASVVAECEALAARVAELGLALIREADDRDLARRTGATSTSAWLRHRLHLRPGEARARLDLAHRIRHATGDEQIAGDDGTGGETGLDRAASVSSGTPARGAMPTTGAVRGRLDREGMAQVMAALDPWPHRAPALTAPSTRDPRPGGSPMPSSSWPAAPVTRATSSPPRVAPARTSP